MSPRSKSLFAAVTLAVSILAMAAYRGIEPVDASADSIESPDSPASPASEPRNKSTAKNGAVLVERELTREEGTALVAKLLREERGAAVSGAREVTRADVEKILREPGVTVTVDERGVVRVRRAPPAAAAKTAKQTAKAGKAQAENPRASETAAATEIVRVIPREQGQSLADALLREEAAASKTATASVSGKRSFGSIESRSRDVGANDPEIEKLLAKDAPYVVRSVEETDVSLPEGRGEARSSAAEARPAEARADALGAGGSWKFEKHGAIASAQPALVRRNDLPDGENVPESVAGRIQLASAGAPLAAIVPPDVKDLQIPTPAPTPAFCPEGTTEQWKKTKTAKERFCLRTDRGGVPVKQGPFVTHYPSGKVRAEGEFENGRASGIWVEYHPNGKKSGEGAYKNGRRHGTWTFWWASGALQSRGEFQNDLKMGRWTWFDDKGRKESEGVIRTADNLEHEQGKWVYYHANGKKRAEGVMKNGRREGRWTEWSADGRVRSIDEYRGGDKES